MMDTPTYATLLNRKLLVPSPRQPYVAVDAHFIFDLMMPLLEMIHVDEAWYLSTYPDVGAAIQNGVVPDANSHYCRFGYYEHRMPYQILVDELWYLNEYPDVRDAVTSKVFGTGQNHFEQLGYKEGRIPYAGFHLQSKAKMRG